MRMAPDLTTTYVIDGGFSGNDQLCSVSETFMQHVLYLSRKSKNTARRSHYINPEITNNRQSKAPLKAIPMWFTTQDSHQQM